MALSVLAIAPHPDDEVIGCGGSLAKHVSQGASVVVAVVVERERSEHDAERSDDDLLAEARLAGKRLGVDRVEQFGYASRGDWPKQRLIGDLVRVIRQTAPDIVYLPHPGEGDPEHSAIASLAKQALWLAASPHMTTAYGSSVPVARLVLGYEVWTPVTSPGYVEDISEFIDAKLYALEAYQSQLDVKQFAAASRGLAAYRGVMSGGCDFAEAFSVERLGSPPAMPTAAKTRAQPRPRPELG